MANTKRLSRRMAGLLKARLPDLRLEAVRDPRKARGKRWPLAVVLRICVVGLMSRCKSLAQTESLSDEMNTGMARLLGISRRVPDTSMRDVLVKVSPRHLRKSIHRQIKAANRMLESRQKHVAQTVDIVGKYEVIRRLYQTEEMAGYLNWGHLRTVLRVESKKVQISTGIEVEYENRYFISSLSGKDLNNEQWLYMIRQHWCVENHCHQTWDMAFMEDDHPWIENDPQGTLVVMLLRRMAYNLMALFRSVSQRTDQRRQAPWKDVMRWLYNALISVDEFQICTLRQRHQIANTS